ncbi:MAG: class I SAM-dependent methyltransferase [Desulfomonile tiedjei]|nr:class I SAM-dependent methyltransferase [Desulfomonile tiedjei]
MAQFGAAEIVRSQQTSDRIWPAGERATGDLAEPSIGADTGARGLHEVTGNFDAKSIRHHRHLCLKVLRHLALTAPARAFDEHALPSYLHPNHLARWLFWQRVTSCARFLSRTTGGACLDFGCGSGVMLPFLARAFSRVYAVDPSLAAVTGFIDLWEKSAGGSLQAVRLSHDLPSATIPHHSLQLILALDVLEHVEDLQKTLADLALLLAPGGILLVSGPTENRLYRLGRRIAGFSGHYHLRNIHDIMDELQQLFSVKIVRRLVYPLTFFCILEARKR